MTWSDSSWRFACGDVLSFLTDARKLQRNIKYKEIQKYKKWTPAHSTTPLPIPQSPLRRLDRSALSPKIPAPDAAHALLSKVHTIEAKKHRKHCLPQDWLTFSWMSVCLLPDGLGLTVFDKVHCALCTAAGAAWVGKFKNWCNPQSDTPETQKHKKNCCDKLDYYGEWVGRGVSCWIGTFSETTPG